MIYEFSNLGYNYSKKLPKERNDVKEKILFEIPIYSMSRDEFDAKWSARCAALYNHLIEHGHTDDSAKESVSAICYPYRVWEYNQIVGYIKISVSATDVLFRLYCSMEKRHRFNSKEKHFIQDWGITGAHFYADGMSNKEIKEGIRFWLNAIEKDYLHKKYHVEYETFNNVFDFIDIREIMETI